MRTLIAVALIAVLGAAALGLAWRVLGKVQSTQAVSPQPAASAPAHEAAPGPGPQRVEWRDEPVAASAEVEQVRAPVGLEEGGGAPLVRDWAAIYADRTREERLAAAERLRGEIEAARAALDDAARQELAGKRGNALTTPPVARLLDLIEERAWLMAQLAAAPKDGR